MWKQNVSDSAEACSDCGYGIKAHFDKIKFEEEEKIRKQTLEEREKEQLEAIQMPPKPNAKQTYLLVFLMFGIWGVPFLILPSPINIIGFFSS